MEVDEDESDNIESVADGSMDDGHLDIIVHNIKDKDKFKLFIRYRGKCTEQYAKALHNLQAPCRLIMTLWKLKTVLPPLKPPVEWSMRSDVIYQIMCPRCHGMIAVLPLGLFLAKLELKVRVFPDGIFQSKKIHYMVLHCRWYLGI